MCRILVALGAVASGRLGTLTDTAVHHWLMEVAEDQIAQTNYQAARQQVWAQNARESEIELLVSLKKLAIISQVLSQSAEVQPIVQESIRMTLGQVLRDVLRSGSSCVRRFDTPPVSPSADLNRIARLLPPWCMDAFLTGYGAMHHSSLENRPSQPRRLRVRRATLATSGPDPAGFIQHTLEKDLVKELSDIPRIDIKFDEHEAADPTPGEGMIVGRTFNMDGRRKRVEGILGEGKDKIVYSVVDVETGEKTAFATFKESRSEKDQLLAELGELIKDLDKNQHEILKISDRVLEVDPNNESVLFNKGNILLSLNDENGALDCFRRAIEVAPKDLLNRLHAAVALSRLERHEESLTCVSHAVELAAIEAAQYLYELPWMNEALLASARAVAKGSPSNEGVRTLLELFEFVDSERNATST